VQQSAAAAACVWKRVGSWRCKEQQLTATSWKYVELSYRHCAQDDSWKFAKDILDSS
jgi:hypothetical protein